MFLVAGFFTAAGSSVLLAETICQIEYNGNKLRQRACPVITAG
jgi:hypothetical protein